MALFQKHGVNPLAGCLPIFVQMPVLIAIFHAIRRTPELNTGSFLWFELGSPDPYFILPIVAAGATFLQQKLMMAGSPAGQNPQMQIMLDRKSTRLNSSHVAISYAVFCLKKKNNSNCKTSGSC